MMGPITGEKESSLCSEEREHCVNTDTLIHESKRTSTEQGQKLGTTVHILILEMTYPCFCLLTGLNLQAQMEASSS